MKLVLALVPAAVADELDVCPRAACGHRGSDHGVLSTGCMVDECPCGEFEHNDRQARAAIAENFTGIPITDDERARRGFATKQGNEP